ncbi:nucleoside 2-deoxyribosyltransferase [Bradyrhizobium sp. WD16]|uniref:nucleoside 2-deoxyribosyltransferase n=1 Tax=Bradyrhizobium sp. WD16 TaxID=1521768 RepID=UPI0020A5BB2B|nr:nucleoside 2-deoxyribosyltransferase [Bradyrhizobium sp. WD16]
MMPRHYVYLAGPGVFRHDAPEFSAGLKELCQTHGLSALWPLDNTIEAVGRAAQAEAIRRANEAMIRRAVAVIADISPFRGPNMDPGTAYEIGFALALEKPVFAYSTDRRSLLTRTVPAAGADGVARDEAGLLVEDFGLLENLMIATAVAAVTHSAAAAIAACAAHLNATQRG